MANYQWNPLTDEKKFEDLVNDLCSEKYGLEFQIYGRKGQKQYGIDGSALTKENKYILHQCKNKMISRSDSAIQKELLNDLEIETNSMIEEFIKKRECTLDKFIFANSFKRDTQLQDKAMELSELNGISIVIWSWDEISDMLEEYIDIAKKYYPQNQYVNKISNTKLSPQLTTTLGKAPNFIGRKNETNELIEKLNKHKAIVVHGIGGIGKSSFVSAYLNTHKNEFKYYGFINWTDNIKLDFFNSLHVNMKLEDYNNIDKNFDEVMKNLRALGGQKLLIIDKVEEKEINYKEEEKSIRDILNLTDTKNNYKIIFTSRFKINSLTPYFLKPLNEEDAKEIFLTHCKTKKIEKVYKILKYLGYHALFIELVAKTIKNEGYTLDDIIDKFERGELSKIEFIDEESGDEVTFNQNLQELFSMQNLKDEYVLLLKRLSVLPSIDIELSFLEEVLGNERLKGRLNFLVGRGWLIENGGSYKLHQIIKEFLLANYSSHFKEIETIINYFLEYEIKIEEWITIFLESVASFCIQYSMEDKKVGDLYYLLGRKYYDDLANMRKSEIYLNNAKKLDIAVEDIIDIYHRLGSINNNIDYLKKALSHYTQEGNEEQKAICLDNIGSVYWNQNEPNEALVYFKKSLEFLKENDFRGRAINYNQQSLVYKSKDEICKAFKYQLKAIKAIKKAREEDDSKLNKREEAQLINNLGELYMDETKHYTKAFKYLKEALDLREKILYAGHERFGESYDNIAIIFEKKNDLREAYKYQLEAIKIWEESPPEKDIYLEEAKERLKDIKKRL